MKNWSLGTKILVVSLVAIALLVFFNWLKNRNNSNVHNSDWDLQISPRSVTQITNNEASRFDSNYCDNLLAQIKQVKAQYMQAQLNGNTAQANQLNQFLHSLITQYNSNCGHSNVPIPINIINDPVWCDPKHHGYDMNGKPRKECGYTGGGIPVPVPNPPTMTCEQITDKINYFKQQLSQYTCSTITPNNQKICDGAKASLIYWQNLYNQKHCKGKA